MRHFGFGARVLAAALALGLAAGGALAMGSGSGGGGGSAAAPASDDWAAAKQAIAAKNYDAAVPLLKKVVAVDPNNADALNYLGYSHARAGKHDEALAYYKQALVLKPEHRGANEYLGELYLRMGNLPAAEERLAVLDKACLFGCPEYDELKGAVERYRQTGKFDGGKGF